MKLTRSIRTSNRGSVVIIALTVVAIAAIMLGSYLTLVQFQTSAVARSQAWNASIAMTEAGIEEGMAVVNKGYPAMITDQWAWTSGIDSDGWAAWNNDNTTITRYMATNGYGVSSYSVIITNVNNSPQVSAVGYVPYTSVPWAYDTKSTFLSMMSFSLRPFFAAAGASPAGGSTIMVARKVQVQTAMDSVFMMGLVAKSNINMNGNNILVDSYDSSNTNYSKVVTSSTWGTNWVYDSSKRRDKGDVATDSALVNAVSVGNANIYGKLHTGPGSQTTTATIGPNGSVGDLSWQTGGHTGFQTNSWLSDMNVNFPDVPAPTGVGIPPIGGVYAGNTYDYNLSSPGAFYAVNSTISGQVVVTAKNTILWAKGGLDFSGKSDGIFIAPGASVVIYVGNTTGSAVTADLTGQGGINANGYAKNCQIYGLPTCTSISMSGNAAFVGTIYAPNATLSGSGGGNNNLDSMGAVIVKDVALNGHWNFHYDESLRVNGPLRGWIVKNWQEVAAQ